MIQGKIQPRGNDRISITKLVPYNSLNNHIRLLLLTIKRRLIHRKQVTDIFEIFGMTVSNPKWSDDELEQLLSWWEANYETTLSENVKPATWTSQVREAGLSTRTCPQIKQKWHNWTFSYKKARKIALKSCWENSSEVSLAGAGKAGFDQFLYFQH